jgi:predicted nucleic acid-binding protein
VDAAGCKAVFPEGGCRCGHVREEVNWNLTPITSVDGAVADHWGRLAAAAGRPLPAVDSLLAATALKHDLVLVTRNVQDFAGLPVQIFNPWAS